MSQAVCNKKVKHGFQKKESEQQDQWPITEKEQVNECTQSFFVFMPLLTLSFALSLLCMCLFV